MSRDRGRGTRGGVLGLADYIVQRDPQTFKQINPDLLFMDSMAARKAKVFLVGYLPAPRLGGLDNSEILLRKLFRLDALVTSTGKHVVPGLY